MWHSSSFGNKIDTVIFKDKQRFTGSIISQIDNVLTYLKLINNIIAILNEVNDLFITTAGWNSVTTRERLNGLSGVRLGTKKGQLYLNNISWDGKLTNIRNYESI